MARTKRYGSQWSVSGIEWVYRRPVLDGGKWRCVRRHLQSGRKEKLTLNASNLTAAKDEAQALADAERANAHAEKATGAVVAKPTAMNVAQALAAWTTALAGMGGLRERSLKNYTDFARVLEPRLGAARLVSEISYGDIESLFTGGWATRSGRTKTMYLGNVTRFLDWAVKHGLTRANVARSFVPPKAWSREATRAARETGQGMTVDEMRRLLRACKEEYVVDMRPDLDGEKGQAKLAPPDHLWWFVFLSLRTGLRIGNLLGGPGKEPLKWRHIDLKEALLSLPREAMKNHAPLRVPLHREVVQVLKSRLKRRVPKPDERVVPEVAELKKSFRAALRRTGLEDKSTGNFLGELRRLDNPRRFRLHDLRHSFASMLGAAAPFFVTKSLLGHASSEVTARYAGHQGMNELRKWLDGLADLVVSERLRADIKTLDEPQRAQ